MNMAHFDSTLYYIIMMLYPATQEALATTVVVESLTCQVMRGEKRTSYCNSECNVIRAYDDN